MSRHANLYTSVRTKISCSVSKFLEKENMSKRQIFKHSFVFHLTSYIAIIQHQTQKFRKRLTFTCNIYILIFSNCTVQHALYVMKSEHCHKAE